MSEVNGLVNGREYHAAREHVRLYLDWSDSDLKEVTRLRLISDPGYPMWDVSYCHGITHDGEMCDVQLPFHQIPKGKVSQFIVSQARLHGVYAKGLGILENISTLV